MKRYLLLLTTVLGVGILLSSCQPETVSPATGKSDSPSLAGRFGNPGFTFDTTCQVSDTLFLVREDDGSPYINKCYMGGYSVNCNNTTTRWGYAIVQEGYSRNVNSLDVEFQMAFGWYSSNVIYAFKNMDAFQFDRNGHPSVGPAWTSALSPIAQNNFHINAGLNQIQSPTFGIAIHVSAVRLNLFGAILPGSSTSLWCKNRNPQVHIDGTADSQWVLSMTPMHCLSPGSTNKVQNKDLKGKLAQGNPQTF